MIVYDFEVFMYNWLVVFKDLTNQTRTIIVDNKEELTEFYLENQNKIFVGYNNKDYDDYIFRAIMSGVDPYTMTVALFNCDNKYSLYKTFDIKQVPLISVDLMQDILGMSLKQGEGYMNLSVDECSVPFNLDRELTKEEIKEVIRYCCHDVDATEALLHVREQYVKSKLDIIKLFKLPINAISKTNAGLCALVLNATKKERNDELKYDIIPEIQINNPVYKQVLELYTSGDLDYTKTMNVDVCGVPHKFAYGGLHSARENFVYDGEMWNLDVTSYYPSMMIQYNFHSRNIKDPKVYENIYNERVTAKHSGDSSKANALKLILNTTYGAMKSEFNGLYDPKMANQVCITGQLLFLDLLEKLEPYITLVQTNTDGILVIPRNKEKVIDIVNEWQQRTRMSLKIDKCNKIWQKDVNNYIMLVEKDGSYKIKTKGAYVSQYYQKIRNNVRILDKAVVDYFVNGISPEDTINNETDIHLFQYITKSGKSYDNTVWLCGDVDIPVNNVNRVYSSKNTNHGTLIKLKNNGERRDSIANLPKHCVVDNNNELTINDIDKQWYIDEAKKRIDSFIG